MQYSSTKQKEFRRLPVIDDKGQMLGIITAKDIFKAVMKTFKQTGKDQDLKSEVLICWDYLEQNNDYN